jgi:hypothetical protein
MFTYTVAQKIAELNAIRKPGNDEWESYRTLSAEETMPVNQLKSLGQQVEDVVELFRLREKFEKDPRREIQMVDINRPQNWRTESAQRIKELLAVRKKHENDLRWKRAPRDQDGAPITLDEFIQMLMSPVKAVGIALVMFACLFFGFNASAQQTNLFTNQAPQLPFYPTNTINGGLYGVFLPLYNEPLLNAATNYYTNSNPLIASSTNYQGTNSSVLTNASGIPTNYNGGIIFPVGVPQSLNVTIGVGGFPSNSVADQLICSVDQSADGILWTNLCTISLTNLTGQGAGIFQYGVTNINVGAMSQIRLHSLANNGLGAWTNCLFSVACKVGL